FLDSPERDAFEDYFRKRLSYWAYYIEDVDVAKREINRQITGSRVAEVGSQREIIERNVEKLETKGFSVVRENQSFSQSTKTKEPVQVDVEEKVVRVVENHPALNDYTSIGGEKIPVRYSKWNYSSSLPAVRFATDGIIE